MSNEEKKNAVLSGYVFNYFLNIKNGRKLEVLSTNVVFLAIRGSKNYVKTILILVIHHILENRMMLIESKYWR